MSSNSNSKFSLKYDKEIVEKKTPSPTKKLKAKSSNKSASSDCEIIEEYFYISKNLHNDFKILLLFYLIIKS